ncbi:MAG: peptidase S8/S53 domain-containing protein [Benjaminiella poitrasii]|nr:MAG: peptidase S8/S53 domain-containing protein [Benjaminiella poitrasii]
MSHHRDFLTSVRKIKKEGLSAAAAESEMALDQITIGDDFVAVAGVFSDNGFLEYLHEKSAIEYVEQNQIFRSTLVPAEETVIRAYSHVNATSRQFSKRVVTHLDARGPRVLTAKTANWGLARINQHVKGDLSEYDYDSMGGSGVDVYVLDTGVYSEHSDFQGRVEQLANLVRNEDISDMGGHGTHVAGKIIGQEYGVSKNAQVKAVKILNKMGDGSTSGLLKGIEYVIQNAKPGKSVVNLSLSGPKSKMLDEALNTMVLEYNIPVFVSAGNSGTDACFFSPSSNPNVFTVGATDINDDVPEFSNVGECVSIYAPGVDIVSTFIVDSASIKSMDGTSMASPHVAGIAANLLAKRNYNNVQDLYADIKAYATKNVIKFGIAKSTSPGNNLLAYNQVTG